MRQCGAVCEDGWVGEVLLLLGRRTKDVLRDREGFGHAMLFSAVESGLGHLIAARPYMTSAWPCTLTSVASIVPLYCFAFCAQASSPPPHMSLSVGDGSGAETEAETETETAETSVRGESCAACIRSRPGALFSISTIHPAFPPPPSPVPPCKPKSMCADGVRDHCCGLRLSLRAA